MKPLRVRNLCRTVLTETIEKLFIKMLKLLSKLEKFGESSSALVWATNFVATANSPGAAHRLMM